MKSIRDWVFHQLVPGSFSSPRFLSSSHLEEPENEDFTSSGPTETTAMVTAEALPSSRNDQENSMETPPSQQILVSSPSNESTNSKKSDSLSKIEALQINFFRILKRLKQSPEDILVAKVLYRIHLATLIKAGESDLSRINLRSDKARVLASQQEASQNPLLDFSIRILVLGKTGVGKSATINSIFNQNKTTTNAFKPTTSCIQEVTGFVNGIKILVIDTPGFSPSFTCNVRRNKKIMFSIKKYTRKNPPDVVLYLERLDTMNKGYNDFPLLKLMTEVFGPEMWFNTILVMTNAGASPPEGPTGSPLNYETYVSHYSDILQQYVQMAVSDSKLENPVVLVENHPKCRKNTYGERILPNGQVWKKQLMLLCVCTKVLSDANSLLGFEDSIRLGPSNSFRLPLLPHMLSSFIRERPVSIDGDDEVDEYFLSDFEDEDEYDQLPPIRILTKSQFEKLSDSQKKDYLDELEYRETLFLKKQLKEKSHKRKEDKNLPLEGSLDDPEAIPETIQLPETAIPLTFDCDSRIYRYRGIISSDKWVCRPVLDPQGWDHDVGFDGVSLETALEILRNLNASISGQMSKDKQDFSIHTECGATYTDPKGPEYYTGLGVQSSGRDMVYTLRTHAKSGMIKHNIAGCGVSMILFQNKYYIGTKLEDAFHIGKRLKLAMNAGRMVGPGEAAYCGALEATIRGRDYPVKKDKVSLAMNVMSFKKEIVLGGSFESEFCLLRGVRLSVNANLNNQKKGQICVKTCSSEHVELGLIALFTVCRAIFRRREPKIQVSEVQEVG